MNAKLKPKYKNGKDGGNLDIRLPGIAGRLSQMDARQLEQFVTKETEKKEKEAPSEIRLNTFIISLNFLFSFIHMFSHDLKQFMPIFYF